MQSPKPGAAEVPMNRKQRRKIQQQKKTKAPQRRIVATASLDLLTDLRPYEERELIGLRTTFNLYYADLAKGDITTQAFNYLAELLNTAKVRAEEIDPRLLDDIEPGIAAMKRAVGRYKAGEKLHLDEAGLKEVPVALDIYDQILVLSNPKQMTDAVREVARRGGINNTGVRYVV